jgi:hypothetical protein
MISEMPNGKFVSVVALLFTVVMAGAAGTALGALAFGLGVYLAGFTDMLLPFYSAGARAGLATSVVYTILRPWSQALLPKERVRSVLAAVVGTFVLWMKMSAPDIGMSLSERAVAGLSWLGAVTLLLLFIGWMNGRRVARRPN